jgi:hypothetical protein
MKHLRLLAFAALAVLLTQCYPGGPEYYEEMDIVYTNYDKNYDFKSKGTYAMPDKIVKITGSAIGEEGPEYVPDIYGKTVLAKIEANMTTLGWTKATSPETADLVLFPAVWTNTTVVYWYDYWCWYYPYYCGWGYYYSYPSVSSYTTGTMVMTMVPTAESVVPNSVWTSAINGLMSGAYDATRVTNAIEQAFKQSPYLNTK